MIWKIYSGIYSGHFDFGEGKFQIVNQLILGSNTDAATGREGSKAFIPRRCRLACPARRVQHCGSWHHTTWWHPARSLPSWRRQICSEGSFVASGAWRGRQSGRCGPADRGGLRADPRSGLTCPTRIRKSDCKVGVRGGEWAAGACLGGFGCAGRGGILLA